MSLSKDSEFSKIPPGNFSPSADDFIQAEGIVVQNQVQQPPASPTGSRYWKYGLCVCCSDCNSCLESWCCFYCQLSRQYNMSVEEKSPTIHWPITIGLCLVDRCFLCFASTLFHCLTRRRLRRNLSIYGSDCDDCLVSFCCGPCGVQQSLKELSEMGLFPGACCYDVPLASVRMH